MSRIEFARITLTIQLNTSVAKSRDQYFQRFVAPSPGVQGEFKTLFLSHTCDSITWYREWPIGEYPIRKHPAPFTPLKHASDNVCC